MAINQRTQVAEALTGIVAESGYDAVTIRALIRRAGISTSTFYKLFANVEDCFASLVGTTIPRLTGQVEVPGDSAVDSLSGVRATIDSLMAAAARRPELTRVVLVEAFDGGPQVRREVASAVGAFEGRLAESLELAPRPAVGTAHLAAGAVGGLLRTVRKTTLTGRAEELPGLTDEMTSWVLSVAHEEVVAFRSPGPRSADGKVGARLPRFEAARNSRESVADAGRRAVMATARLAAADGLAGLTSSRIRKDAGLSRSEFHRHFSGVEDCFLDAVESISEMAGAAALESAAGAAGWERSIPRAVSTLCALAAGDRELSRLVLVDVVAPGRRGLLRREHLIDRCVEYVRDQLPHPRRPSDPALGASVGAVWRIAETEVSAGRACQLPRAALAFSYMLLAPARHGVRSPALEIA